MKNIIIMGVGRAGKTTLSKLIKAKYPEYDLIHSDNLKWAIIRANNKEPEFRADIQAQMDWEKSEYYQNILIEYFASAIKYGPVILETGQLYLEHLVNHQRYTQIKDNTEIIVLGTGQRNAVEIANICQKHDTSDSWTFGIDRNKLLDYAKDWERQDKQRFLECEKYGIRYNDTTGDRTKKLSEIMEERELNGIFR